MTRISTGDTMRTDFAEIARLIESARHQALQAVNTTLIDLYWQVGAQISRKLETAEWGDGVVQQLADYLARTQPGLRGFTRPNLFRMRQFFEAYRGDEKVSPLVRQIPWTHNLIILSQCKRPEERDFYLRMAVQERWGKRALERQIKFALFERVVLTPATRSPVLTQTHAEAASVFKDAYMVEFLDLPDGHSEADLHRGLSHRLRDFLIENPAIGVLLCASKDDAVVEYALSRALSPALVAEYRTRLPDKRLLQAKLHEFYTQNSAVPE